MRMRYESVTCLLFRYSRTLPNSSLRTETHESLRIALLALNLQESARANSTQVVKILDQQSESHGFKHHHGQVASVGSLSKTLNFQLLRLYNVTVIDTIPECRRCQIL